MPPIVGVGAFLLVIGAVFAVTIGLTRRYARGTARDRAFENATREIELRDSWTAYPGGGAAPYPGPRDPSPRDRLTSPLDEDE